MITKEIGQKWIAALRSGEYKQGAGCLRNQDNEFCCLGVLAMITEPERFEVSNSNPRVYTFYNSVGTLGEEYFSRTQFDYEEHLIQMNDKHFDNFSVIADYIEKEMLPILPENSPDLITYSDGESEKK